MKYSVNPSVLGSMLAVPSSVAEKHLKLASGDQLKVLLAFFKFAGIDEYIEQITSATGIKSAEVCDCLEYWAENGVLLCDGVSKAAACENKPKIKKPAAVCGKPTREEAVRRAADDAALQWLFDEVQRIMNHGITTAQMTSLVWIHDTYGLPVEVIRMAVEYAKKEEKTNFSYIEKVCIDWAENDVTDLTSAEKRINQLYMIKSAWKYVCSTFGIDMRRPSAKESEFARKWVNEYGYKRDMLKLAYDKCIDSTGKLSFPYIAKIIEMWHKNGINKPEDAEKSNNTSKTENRERKTSYDIDKIKNNFNDFDNLGW